jgi:RNA methyltransferase, TrmH family
MEGNLITSSKNLKVRQLVNLQKPRERKETGLILIEGLKEIFMAVGSGVVLQSVFYCKELIHEGNSELKTLISKNDKYELTEISREVFARVTYRENSSGLIATAKQPVKTLEKLVLSENPLVIVLEKVEKPGNLGAILRTADAAGVDAVLICDNQTDLYNPNVIRSSLGCIFSKQVITCTSEEALGWLKKHGIKPFVTSLEASKVYTECNLAVPCAIVLGAEDKGVSRFWLENSAQNIIIPMCGRVDSMNVSVSTAIVVFEALRQRKIKS